MNFLNSLKPTLTIRQLERLSNIFDNAGQGIFVVAVLTPVIAGFDNLNLLVLVFGIVAALFCWFLSIWVAHKTETYEF